MKDFNYCPNCKSTDMEFDGNTRFYCPECHFEFFKNVAAGVVGIYEYKGQILFQIRGQEPSKGMLDAPGGFLNPGENAEQALQRETFEEIGLTLNEFKYLGTAPNRYLFKQIVYNVCDIIFYARLDKLPTNLDQKEVDGIALYPIDQVPLEQIAFPSIVTALNFAKLFKADQQ